MCREHGNCYPGIQILFATITSLPAGRSSGDADLQKKANPL
jgi:hypothetical protein